LCVAAGGFDHQAIGSAPDVTQKGNEMTDWQQRVIEERDELRVKIRKLVLFIYQDSSLDEIDRKLLSDQLLAMIQFDSTLCARIDKLVSPTLETKV